MIQLSEGLFLVILSGAFDLSTLCGVELRGSVGEGGLMHRDQMGIK